MASDDAGGLPVYGALVAALVVAASVAGLTVEGIYRDNLLVRSSWRLWIPIGCACLVGAIALLRATGSPPDHAPAVPAPRR